MGRCSQPACEPGTVKVEQDVNEARLAKIELKAEDLDIPSKLVQKVEAVVVPPTALEHTAIATPFPDLLRPLPHECLVCCWCLLS